MSYGEVMDLPIRAFWLMHGNIRRVKAGEDIRSLVVAMSAQSAEGAKECQERLVLEMGQIARNHEVTPVIQAERDEAGFAELKALAGAL